MREIYLLLLVFSMSTNLISQISYDSIIKPREEIYISENDSIVIKKTLNNINLNFLCDNKLTNLFRTNVFNFSNESSKTVYYLKQWNTPIVVLFDKKIPTEVTSKFKLFFKQLSTVKNLSIKYTSKIEDANYLIKITDDKINKHINKVKFKSKEEKTNHFLYNATYSIQTDGNDKLYSAILKINKKEFNDTVLLKKLKQLFFISLGNFKVFPLNKKNSLLDFNYHNNAIISEDDLNFIKHLYSINYQQKINGTTFNKLIKLAKRKCFK